MVWPVVPDEPASDVLTLAGGPGEGGGARVCLDSSCCGEPGAVIADLREDPCADLGAKAVEAAEPGDIITYHPQRLAAALHIADVNRLAVETSVMGTKALVTIYPHDPHDPLARVVLADPEMLVMDARGRIWIGRYHNGRPSLLRLYDPASGSAQRLLLFGTTGAGKSTAGPADSLEQRLAQLVRMLHTPVVLDDGRSVDVGASVGAAVPHGVGSRDLSLLQRAADASLYDGKHSRRAILATRQHLTVPSINGRRDGRPGTSMWGRAA